MVKIFKDYDELDTQHILSKQKLTKFEKGYFLPLNYNKKAGNSRTTNVPIYVQTPKMTIPFGIMYNDTISFSLDDADIDVFVDKFYRLIMRLEIYSQSEQMRELLISLIGEKDPEIMEIPLNFVSPIKKAANSDTQYINFKIKQANATGCIYNTSKEPVSLSDVIGNRTQGIAIIELLGFWIRKEDSLTPKYNYGLSFQVQQLMVDIINPFSLAMPPLMPTNAQLLAPNTLASAANGAIYTTNIAGPPPLPPPPPPPMPTFSLVDTNKKSIVDIINETKQRNNGNTTLDIIKKTYANKIEHKPPSLDEILNRLKSLRKTDDDDDYQEDDYRVDEYQADPDDYQPEPADDIYQSGDDIGEEYEEILEEYGPDDGPIEESDEE